MIYNLWKQKFSIPNRLARGQWSTMIGGGGGGGRQGGGGGGGGRGGRYDPCWIFKASYEWGARLSTTMHGHCFCRSTNTIPKSLRSKYWSDYNYRKSLFSLRFRVEDGVMVSLRSMRTMHQIFIGLHHRKSHPRFRGRTLMWCTLMWCMPKQLVLHLQNAYDM